MYLSVESDDLLYAACRGLVSPCRALSAQANRVSTRQMPTFLFHRQYRYLTFHGLEMVVPHAPLYRPLSCGCSIIEPLSLL